MLNQIQMIENRTIKAINPFFKDCFQDAVATLIFADTIEKRLILINYVENELI